MASFDRILPWLPVVLVAAGAIASGAVDSFRLSVQAEELNKLSENVEENDEAIEQIQRLLIRRQGEVELQVQRIQSEQESQGEDLEEILLLLKGLSDKR
jgi:hypothetical protein